MDNEVCQIEVEQVLHDALDIVCKYVDGIDLSNMAKVCKSWCCAALREKEKRYFFQQLLLPFKIDNLASKINKIPDASLFIYDSTLKLPEEYDWWRPASKSLEKELLVDLKNQLPKKTIIFKVDKYVPSECDLQPTDQYDIVGFFMSNMEPRLCVHVAWTDFDPHSSWDWEYKQQVVETEVDRLVEELGLDICENSKSTIVWFSLVGSNHYQMIDKLKDRIEQNNNKVEWVGIFGRKLAASYCNNEIHGSVRKLSAFLRISGSSVETWSTLIHYCARSRKIDRKLQKLKKQVKRNKQHYTGLIYSFRCVEPDCNHNGHPCGNSREMMSKLKLAFPYIQFMGLFNDCNSHLYSKTTWFPDRSNRKDNLNGKSVESFLLCKCRIERCIHFQYSRINGITS